MTLLLAETVEKTVSRQFLVSSSTRRSKWKGAACQMKRKVVRFGATATARPKRQFLERHNDHDD